MMDRVGNDFAPLPLRFVLGIGFLYHGYPKLFTAQGHSQFQGMLEQIGVPAAGLMSWAVALFEFFGGLALLAGAFIPIVSLLGMIHMLVALVTVHLPQGFNFINITGMTDSGPQFGMPGYEVNLLYLAGFLALLLGGAGRWSVDRRLAWSRRLAEVPDVHARR